MIILDITMMDKHKIGCSKTKKKTTR